jgi:hypothetical protein
VLMTLTPSQETSGCDVASMISLSLPSPDPLSFLQHLHSVAHRGGVKLEQIAKFLLGKSSSSSGQGLILVCFSGQSKHH